MSQNEAKTYRVTVTSMAKVPIIRPVDDDGNPMPVEVTVGPSTGGLSQDKIEAFKYALEDKLEEMAEELKRKGASDWRSQIKGARRMGEEILSIFEGLRVAGGESKTIELD